MSNNYEGTRLEKKFVEEDERALVHPLDSVPENRDSSWTNGTLAWLKGDSATDDEVIGWWVPPRQRMKKMRPHRAVKSRGSPLEEAKKRYQRPKKNLKAMQENKAKKNIRILRSQGYSMAEAILITRGQMGLDGKPIEQEVPDFEDSDTVEGSDDE